MTDDESLDAHQEAIVEARMEIIKAWLGTICGYPANVTKLKITFHYDDGQQCNVILGIEQPGVKSGRQSDS